jgi:hypothetical protein
VPASICWIGLNGVFSFHDLVRDQWHMPLPDPPQPDFFTQIILEMASFLNGNAVPVVLVVFCFGVLLNFIRRPGAANAENSLDDKKLVFNLDYARGKESPEPESRRINDLRTK